MDNIYIADLIFVAKRVIKSLPEFHGARFSAFLRYACKVNKIKMEDCISAILPFRKGISHINIGDKLRLRLILTDLGVEKLPFICNALFTTDDKGEFSSETLQLVSVIDAVSNKIVTFNPAEGTQMSKFSLDNLKKEASFLLTLDKFTLELISPLRLSLPPGTRVANASELESLCKEDFFYKFPYALLHILNSLKRVGELSIEDKDIQNLPVAVNGATEWVDLRYSKQRRIVLGGIVGDINYEGKIPTYDLALRIVAGQYTGLGRNQRFGLGFYKIPELEIARSIYLPTNTQMR